MQGKIIRKKVEGGLAISEVILLITSIIAFSYVLGNSLPVVSAWGERQCVDLYGLGRVEHQWEILGDGTIKSPVLGTSPRAIWTIEDFCKRYGTKQGVCGSGYIIKPGSIGPCSEPAAPATTPSITSLAIPSFTGAAAQKILDAAVPKMAAGAIPPVTSAVPQPGAADFVGPLKSEAQLTGGAGIKTAPIIYAGIAVVLISIYTYFSILKKTGDSSRALEAAGRVLISAGLGAGAGYLVSLVAGPAGWMIGAGMILGALFSSWLKREQDREITFVCKPWQTQTGGAKCESCNNQDFPCTEYQCKSLGTGCEIINKDTDEPRCIWEDPNDVNPPEIQPWEDALIEDYSYVPLPPIEGTGVEIKYETSDDGCSPAFQPFTFGVELNKDGYCRIDSKRTADFSGMGFDFGGTNLYKKNHSQQMSFPGVVHLENAGINLTNDGEFEFYVRCEAATNGKANLDEFIFKFCIDTGPDTTSPEIRGFNWVDGAPIAYFEEDETKEVDIQVYANEPAQCKWSHEDKSYESMENNLTCLNSLENINAQFSYTCAGKLTGIENNRENKFFFRCNDTFGNVNIQSRTLRLIGTQPLFISSAKPNATTIKSSTNEIKVTLEAETSAGYQSGKATCEYSNTGTSGSYVLFSDTDSHQHSTNIWFGPGDYNYFIRCFDLAGNSDTREVSFTVETDTYAPIVVRVFRDGMNLKIMTNEEAACVYSNDDCLYEFEDGLEMTTSDDKMHSIGWDSNKNFYIKCQDEFGNQPAPQSCSIIARPFGV